MPKSCSVSYLTEYSVIHKSTECWGPDAREWNPDRWLADDIASKEKYWFVVGIISYLTKYSECLLIS